MTRVVSVVMLLVAALAAPPLPAPSSQKRSTGSPLYTPNAAVAGMTEVNQYFKVLFSELRRPRARCGC